MLEKIKQNPWYFFSPFLVLYVVFVGLLHKDALEGDEGRYIMFAQNLLNGFYSPKEELNLWNGPGYPILLMPFLALELPLILITLLNAFLQYVSIVLLYKTIKIYASNVTALFFSLIWACYYPSYRGMAEILTETLSLFLITLVIFSICKAFHSSKKIYVITAGVSIGYLVLTKIIFGYALLILLVFLLFLNSLKSVFKTASLSKVPKLLSIHTIAFVCILPYISYTYAMTSRFFYFGNSGGMSLYWMSTPFENEYGDWKNQNLRDECTACALCNIEQLEKNHRQNLDYILQFKGLARDDAYKKIAIQNIKSHPAKFLRNCFANQSRLWFGLPNSYHTEQDTTILKFLPNVFLLTFFLIALPLWCYNFKSVPSEVSLLLFLLLLYLILSTIVSVYMRQFCVVVPIILLWLSVIFSRTLTIKTKFEVENDGLLSNQKLPI